MKNKRFLIIVGLISFLAVIFGINNTFSGNASGLSFAFFIFGFFTWDDAFILGCFLFLMSIILWFKNKPSLTGLAFSCYVFFRSFIEVLYGLNAQFSDTTRPWETFMINISNKTNLKVVELYVIYQIFFTGICVFSFVVLVFYFKKYFKED